MKKIITLSVLLFSALSLFAGKVTQQQALQKAIAFAQHANLKSVSANARVAYKAMSATSASDEALFYAFNLGQNEGFVLVSGDDRTADILGYADNGTFDVNNIPENMKAVVEDWERELQWLDLQPTDVQAKLTTASHKLPSTVVEPLMTTKWNQSAPYNNLCPKVGNTTCPTGCVATAMAQIMNYNRHPTNATGSTSRYVTGSIVVNALQPTVFDWMLMLDEYNSSSDENSKAEVAKLMQYCGASVQMGYTASSSGAVSVNVVKALQRTFGYPSSVRIIARSAYTIDEWDEIVTTELVNKRPFYISAATTDGGGHAFVCDGRDENALYHINWGWGGYCDGFYRMSLLNPAGSGIGGSSTTSKWSFRQAAIIGIAPTAATVSSKVKPVSTLTVGQPSVLGERVLTRSSAASNFPSLAVSIPFTNEGDNQDYVYGIGLYRGDEFVGYAGTSSAMMYAGYTYGETRKEVISTFGANLPDGTYRMVPMARKMSEKAMTPVVNSDRNYIQAVISGNEMTLTIMPQEDFFVTNHYISGRYLVFDFENRGEEYNGYIWLRNSKNQIIGKEYVAIPAHSKDQVAIWTDNAGSLTSNDVFSLATDYYQMHCFYTNGTNVDTRLTKSVDLLNANDSKNTVYGQTVHFNVNVKNWGEGRYLHTLKTQLFTTDSETPLYEKQEIIDVAAGKEVSIPMQFDLADNEIGKRCYIVATHTYGEEEIETQTRQFDVAQGIVMYDGNGGVTAQPNSTSLTVPATVCAVDLRQSNVTNITINDNPNTIYICSATIPAAITGKNVISSVGRTGQLSLYDGYDYYFPIAVQARKIYYYRTISADETDNFSLITLPFAPNVVKNVTDGNATLKWTAGEDETPDFWWQYVEGAYENNIYLQDLTTAENNKPYFLMFPASFSGKQVVFQREMGSTNYYTIPSSFDNKMSNRVLDIFFYGTRNYATVNGKYTLVNGTFVKSTADVVVPPFRAYIDADMAADNISIKSNALTTSIKSISTEQQTNSQSAWYTLDGQRLNAQPAQKGVYIHNGKKVVIK